MTFHYCRRMYLSDVYAGSFHNATLHFWGTCTFRVLFLCAQTYSAFIVTVCYSGSLQRISLNISYPYPGKGELDQFSHLLPVRPLPCCSVSSLLQRPPFLFANCNHSGTTSAFFTWMNVLLSQQFRKDLLRDCKPRHHLHDIVVLYWRSI